MKTYVCSVCGYVYDEAKGIPGSGIPAGTRWEDLPDGWVCPLCGAAKGAFREQGAASAQSAEAEALEFERELSPIELSAICSNLARGCEKQYLPAESEKFSELAAYFRSRAPLGGDSAPADLLELVERDLSRGFPYARAAAEKAADRGALRALVWSEKVTNMLKNLLERREREGEAMLENTGVYVCTICGFVSVGDAPPELCPVCKVPSWKFEKVEGRAM